jgi:hypothetical protein
VIILWPSCLEEESSWIYVGRPLTIKTRKELLATIKPSMRRYLRADTGDLPDDVPPPQAGREFITLMPQSV